MTNIPEILKVKIANHWSSFLKLTDTFNSEATGINEAVTLPLDSEWAVYEIKIV